MGKLGALFFVAIVVFSAGSTPSSGQSDTSGLVSDERWRAQQDEYLEFATETLEPGSVTNVIAHAARAQRDDDFVFDAERVNAADFAPAFEKIDTFADTADFDLLYLTNLWYGYRRVLPDDVRTAIEDRMHSFKYWFTEPTPAGEVDDRYYWSENHRIIFYADEFLAGQAFPEAT